MSIEKLLGSMVEVNVENDDQFLIIKETLSRVGVGSFKEKKLWQSCHILCRHGKYYIAHFKELYALLGRENTFDESDKARRDTIANLLVQWNMTTIKNPEVLGSVNNVSVRILSAAEKKNWTCIEKFGTKPNWQVVRGV